MKSRILGAVGALLLLVAAGPYVEPEPTRWAVIIGVSDYQNFGDEVGGDLPGAANDARAMKEVLTQRWGFPVENVRLMIDEQASRAGIESALTEWLPQRVREGDVVVFYFAGHGSQTWNEDGTEDDGLDETICPWDALRSSSANDIRDKELGAWLRALPTSRVTAILDSCHSGSATRAVTPFSRPRTLGRGVNDIPRPAAIGQLPAGRTRAVGDAAAEAAPSGGSGGPADGTLASGADILELAAARQDQVAMDVAWPHQSGGGHTWGGAFTTVLVGHLWNVSTEMSYEEVFRMTRNELRRRGFQQQPQIHSPRGYQKLALFTPAPGAAPPPVTLPPVAALPPGGVAPPAATSAPPAPAAVESGTREVRLPIREMLDARTAVLGGGMAANVTVGSLFTAGSALLRVTSVEPDRALASVLDVPATRGIGVAQQQDTLAAGGFARLNSYRFPEVRLRVSVAELPSAARQALAERLRGVANVVLRDDPQAISELIVREVAGRYVVYGMDGFVRHSVAAPTPAAGAAPLAELLRQELGARTLGAVENPASPFPLQLSFGGEQNRFRIGDEVEFRVTSGRAGYLTIVDLGTDGNVSVIFPNEWERNNRVGAGQEVVLPSRTMRQRGIVFVAQEPAGRGTLRAFVTPSPLVLPFAQTDATGAEQVLRALRRAAGDSPLADTEALRVDSWATSLIVYEALPRD